MAHDERLAEPIRTALSTRRDVVERRMFGGIAFMIRGHMSCGIVGSTLMVRVDPAGADRLLREPHTRPMDFTGRPLRGLLFEDPPGIATAPALGAWIRTAVAWAESQPVKVPGTSPAADARPPRRTSVPGRKPTR